MRLVLPGPFSARGFGAQAGFSLGAAEIQILKEEGVTGIALLLGLQELNSSLF